MTSNADLSNVLSLELPAWICVDVETSGPNPSQYSLLSIGACTFTQPRHTFYVELRPQSEAAVPEAMEINQLSISELMEHGLAPAEAMQRFEEWVLQVVPAGRKPVFVAFNAPFDWMFINDYFLRFLGRNPFGHSALDIKAYYMGKTGKSWAETSMRAINRQIPAAGPLSHHALQDAIDQAVLFEAILKQPLD